MGVRESVLSFPDVDSAVPGMIEQDGIEAVPGHRVSRSQQSGDGLRPAGGAHDDPVDRQGVRGFHGIPYAELYQFGDGFPAEIAAAEFRAGKTNFFIQPDF